jgi:rod shape-determining protein MreC
MMSEYLNLRTENEALALENARLKSILFNTKDTSFLKKEWINKKESLLMIFSIESIHNSYNVHENFLTLNPDLMMELNKIWV